MQPTRVALCLGTTDGAPDDDARSLPGRPAELDALLAQVASLPRGAWVILGGPAPTSHPAFEDIAAALRDRGLLLKLRSGEANIDAARLRGAGVELLQLLLHSAHPAQHDAITGVAGSAEGALATWRSAVQSHLHVEVFARIEAGNLADLADLVRLAGERRAPLFLAWEGRRARAPVPRAKALAAAGAALAEADRCGAKVTVTGLEGPEDGALPDGLDVGENVARALSSGVPLPGAASGLRLADGISDDRALAFAASGWPALNRPPERGGVGMHGGALPPVWAPSPGDRVHLVLPAISDNTLTLSGFPGLYRALVRAGAQVTWTSAWGPPNETIPSTMGSRRRDEVAAATAAEADMLDGIDLSAADLVVVPGWRAAASILPRLPRHARLVIADFHMLSEVDAWRAATGDVWPEKAVVHSCFPGYAHLYLRKRVPLDRVLWRPYPIDRGTLRPGPPAVEQSRAFAGGNQRREWSLLLEAGKRARTAQIDLYTRDRPPSELPPALTWRGTADLLPFYEAIAGSRFVVLPLRWDRDVASGLTVAAMAIASGRPVVSTLTPGTRDHLRDGVDTVMVPPQRPDQLAAELDRLATDDAEVARLAAGAERAAERLSVDRWATELLHGATPARAFGGRGDGPPWYPW